MLVRDETSLRLLGFSYTTDVYETIENSMVPYIDSSNDI
jgi:hypothetical protein